MTHSYLIFSFQYCYFYKKKSKFFSEKKVYRDPTLLTMRTPVYIATQRQFCVHPDSGICSSFTKQKGLRGSSLNNNWHIRRALKSSSRGSFRQRSPPTDAGQQPSTKYREELWFHFSKKNVHQQQPHEPS